MNNSTINLILTTEYLTDELLYYNIYPTKYSSNYHRIEISFEVDFEPLPLFTCLLFKNTLWAKISQDMQNILNKRPPLIINNLDIYAEKLLDPITIVVNQHILQLIPLPY